MPYVMMRQDNLIQGVEAVTHSFLHRKQCNLNVGKMRTGATLAAITDRSLFEILANAVIRRKFPLFQNLIATGINPQGETVKDPLDGFVRIEKGVFGLVAHTTDSTNL